MDVVAVPVARVDDMLNESVYEGEGDVVRPCTSSAGDIDHQYRHHNPHSPTLINAPFWLERDRASGETWADRMENASTLLASIRGPSCLYPRTTKFQSR